MARTSLKNIMLSSVIVAGLALLLLSEAEGDVELSECAKNALEGKSIHIPHEYDCTRYYTCIGDRKILQWCPVMPGAANRYYFNPKRDGCDWPWNTECYLPLPLKSMQKTLLEPKAIPTHCPKVDSKSETVHLAHEWDCTKFYKCFQGKKVVMSCPFDLDNNKLYFNPSEQACDWPYNVDCQMPELLKMRPLAECDPPTKCPRVDSKNYTVHLAHPLDCTKFYKCLQGKPIEMSCPPDEDGLKLYFNPCEQVCDWRWNVNCSNEINYLY